MQPIRTAFHGLLVMLAFAFAATSQAQNRQMTFPGTVREAPTSPDRRDEIVAPPPAAEATAQTTERRTTAAAQDSREDRLARAYQLRPQDQLNIEVFEEPEIGTTQRIDRDGRVRVMFLGTVSLSGMTARQAEQHLEQRFIEERYLRRPMVSVSIVEYAPRFVQISGAVPNPGNVFFDPEEERVELITAILRSGGFNDDANLRKIAITRTLDDGTEQIFIKDVNDKVKGRRGAADYKPFFLMPGDLVFVHDKVI